MNSKASSWAAKEQCHVLSVKPKLPSPSLHPQDLPPCQPDRSPSCFEHVHFYLHFVCLSTKCSEAVSSCCCESGVYFNDLNSDGLSVFAHAFPLVLMHGFTANAFTYISELHNPSLCFAMFSLCFIALYYAFIIGNLYKG